jgi:antitoxin component YwqK of YwqJK toxin-antitoxin module
MTEVKYTYYPNGQLASEWIEINGKKDGYYKRYYSNGQIWCICSYIDDKLSGEYKSYDEYGDLINQSIWDNNGKEIKDVL